jgi:phosphoglucomutase
VRESAEGQAPVLGGNNVQTYNAQKKYMEWLTYPEHPEDIASELAALQGHPEDVEDRFYRELAFGTGGLRGILGAGTNRMNIYTVRRATWGLAQHILARGGADRGVAVGYDCRRYSAEFALEVGLVLAAAGIKAYVFEHLCPTPELSFAVRHLQAAGGVMITASHNPPEYNGYKVYDETGCQILESDASAIMQQIDRVEDWFFVPVMDRAKAEAAGLLQWIGRAVDDAYVQTVLDTLTLPTVSKEARAALHVVYSPLHGTGNVPVQSVLARSGFTQVAVVSSQEQPDGAFPTVKSPNPEERSAFKEALALAESQAADIALATDPDADRVGVAVRGKDGQYTLLTGNQVGGLLVNFWLSQKEQLGTLPGNGIVFKTIVTSEFGAEIARRFGATVEDTLTGFKYIGDRIAHYQQDGSHAFLFGYEESYGYLAADFVRDKDAVQICFLVCQMAAFYKAQGKTLLDVLGELFEEVGYFAEALISETLPGVDGMEKMARIMDTVRKHGVSVDGLSLVAKEDYKTSERFVYEPGGNAPEQVERLTLPKSDVLKFTFAGGAWLAIRPSGTEPKIKIYLGARADTEPACTEVLNHLRSAADAILKLA